MATTDQEQLRKELSAERQELAGAVETLRSKVRARATAVGLSLAVAGGVGAAMRLLFRRR
jgi:hypothetical protein